MNDTPATPTAPAAVPASHHREDVTFLSSGVPCAAWLYRPTTPTDGPRPIVVMAHGLGATRRWRLDLYAERFVAAGYAALVFDYRGFGDSGGSQRQVVDIREQLDDWHAALAFVRSREEFDPGRIAIWGTSFGGGHVLQVAADDREGLAAVVAQCPFTDGVASMWRRFLASPMSASALFLVGIVDLIGARFGRRPVLVPMSGTPVMPAFMASHDALSGASAMAPAGTRLSARTSRSLQRFGFVRRRVSEHLAPSDVVVDRAQDTLWGVLIAPDGALMINAIAARLAVTLARYRPARALRRTGDTPILICACDFDTVAPVGPTVRAARRRRNVQLNRYPYGHFSIYIDESFDRAIGDQLAFLQQHVPVAV